MGRKGWKLLAHRHALRELARRLHLRQPAPAKKTGVAQVKLSQNRTPPCEVCLNLSAGDGASPPIPSLHLVSAGWTSATPIQAAPRT
jgi:hypothetical protein